MTMQRAWLRLCAAVAVVVCLAGPSVAQEFRATVTGRIVDASDLAVPGATVTITNTQTSEVTSVTTSENGAYSVPFLRPGVYTLRAELAGFKSFQQEKLELQVGQTATINIRMEVGELSEQITVTADAVDASKADRGMVIDNKRVTELPLNARNPFMLSTLAPGITYNGPAIYQRPFDNGAIADWSINGGANRNNEFLLDGAPNNALQGGNNIAYVPPVDSVQEFKIITNSYDAQYGRTAGGVVNVSLKSGTNTFHGTAYEFARRRAWDANEVLFNANRREKPDHKLDQYGFQIDGPVIRNKLFFMFNYEGYDESTPNPATLTVPRPEFLSGDFSNLRDAQGRLITIYDPLSGRVVNGQWVRDPFPNNQIPANRINPVSAQVAQYFLQPNTAPTSGNPWQGNYFFGPNLAVDDFYNIATKVDTNVSDRTKMYVRYGQNKRTEIRYGNGIESGPAQDGQLPLERINYTGVWDMVRTTGSSLVLNIRTGLNQYVEAARTEAGLGFDAAGLGFPASYAGQVPIQMFPRFQFSDSYANLGRGNFNRETTTVLSVQPNATWTWGRHTMRTGLDARFTWFTRTPSGAGGGQFNFDRGFTQRDFQNGDPLSGHPIASFLLGYPSASNTFVDNNLFPEFRWNYFAPWFQDDWKIGNRLTINLGFRWDFNTPIWEEQDRINYGFDPTVVNPVSTRINQTAFPGYTVNGGLGFVGQQGALERYPYQYDGNNIQPRVGFAYMLRDTTILRGGVGRYFLNVTGTTTQNGFSIQTPYVASLDAGRTPAASLSNPYPAGIATPPGSSQGLETFLGRGYGFSNPDFINPYVDQFSIGVQQLLPWRTTLEVSYVGSRSKAQQSQWGGYNEPSDDFRRLCDPTVGGRVGFCNELIPNPFFQVPGFEGTSRFTSPTLTRYELARPFPQFGGITQFERNDGRIIYNSLQVMANKRFSGGLTLNGTYTLAKMEEEGVGGNAFVDNITRQINRSPTTQDRRHRVTVSGVYELPFGRDRKWLGNIPRVADLLIGGWDIAGSFLYNSGRPWDLPGNVFYVGDGERELDYSGRFMTGVAPCVAQMDNNGVVGPLFGYSQAAGCTAPSFIVRPPFAARDVPYRLNELRRPRFYQFDVNLAKTTRITDRVRVQFRVEAFNVFNLPMYDERNYVNNTNDANFGRIDKDQVRQSNFPRYVQLGVKLIF